MVGYVDNILLHIAAEKLVEQYASHHRAYRGKPWRIDICSGTVTIGDIDDPRACLVLKKLDDGRLSATGTNERSKRVDELGPVDYLNVIGDGEDLATAVQRICL